MKPQVFIFFISCLAPSVVFADVAKVEAPMPIGSGVHAPAGYVELCRRHPGECDNIIPALTAEASLEESRERWARIFGTRADWAIGAPGSIAVSYARPEILSQGAPAEVSAASPAASEPASAQAPSAVGAIAELDLRHLRKINTQVNRSIRRASDRDTFGREDYWATPEDGAPAGDCEDYVLAKRRALIAAGVSKQALSIALVRTPQGEMHAVLLVATARGEVVLDNLTPWVLPWRKVSYAWLSRQSPGVASQWVRVAQIG